MELYYGGTIYTLVEDGQTVEAVLVRDGIIEKIGSYEELHPYATNIHHLQGAVMYPGFVDSHLHLIGLGEKLIRLQLSECKTKDEMLTFIATKIKTLQPGELLIGEGWNEYQLQDGEMLTIQELDSFQHNPIILHRVCHHVCLINSKAMELAGINNETPDVAGGKIGRTEDGSLNGYFYDEAMNLVTSAFVKDGAEYTQYLAQCINRAVSVMHQYGLVGAHSEDCSYYGHFSNVINAYNQSIGELKHFRVHLLRHHKVFEQMINANLTDVPGFIEYGAMKIFADGSFGGSTAALLEPYENEGDNRGLLIHSNEQFESFIKVARQASEAIAVHMIGDGAADQVISMVEKYPTPIGKRDRLIHCCLLTEQQIERMKKLNIILDIQPSFVPSDFPWVENKIGQHRLPLAYAWKTLSVFPCALGTDAPIEDVNPFQTIYAAVTRKKIGGEQVYNEAQTLSPFEAIKMYTYGSAYAIGKEQDRGLIQEGYSADFTIVDRDLCKVGVEDILKASVMQTVVDGRTVYKKIVQSIVAAIHKN